ncbi:hypothetical protein AYI69_g5886 [Smittium culicis]|uniref:Uncharacterized protein n=1 Tax=Smittium culicis TaxID=133412 RepID=A0A1R1Y2S7_9FUNG|nr:hypothetical protein AYI69_g5886 [Smittium culicis]
MIPQLELPGSSKKQDEPSIKGEKSESRIETSINSELENQNVSSGNLESANLNPKKEKTSNKSRKSVFGESNISLTKTKITQANALLARQKRLLDKSVSLIKNKESLEQIEAKKIQDSKDNADSSSLKNDQNSLLQKSDSGALQAANGDSDSDTTISQLNEAVSNVQTRLLQLKTELDDTKDDEKSRNLLREEIDKLNYFLFQVSGFVASSSIPLDTKEPSLVSSKLNTSTDTTFRAQTPKPASSGDLGLQTKTKSQSLRTGSTNIDSPSLGLYRQDSNSQTTAVSLSGPISQVIGQSSRLGLANAPPSESLIENENSLRILSKRKIQELVSEIDPNERLEPEVEDVSILPHK